MKAMVDEVGSARLENDSPSRGRKLCIILLIQFNKCSRLENDSPSRGRKPNSTKPIGLFTGLENDSPSRGRKQ